MTRASDPAANDFARATRRLMVVWVALLLLLATSLGSAYLRLGVFNTVASYGIALIKIALVVIVFMRWRRADEWSRAAGFMAACAVVLLAGLTWFEGRTRAAAPVPWQVPAQLPSLDSGSAAPPDPNMTRQLPTRHEQADHYDSKPQR
jgi:cytochrome c oxidase subunit 4